MSGRRTLLPVAAASIAMLLLGCTNSETGTTPVPPPATNTTSTPDPTSSPTPTPTPAEPARAEFTEVATDLNVPWGLARLSDGSLLVTQRDTAEVVRILPNGERRSLGTIDGVAPKLEGGLMGIAVAPDDDTQLFIYFSGARDNRVVRYRLEGDRLVQEKVLVDGIPKSGVHNGGRLAFGPDGYLYIGTGDGSEKPNSQDRESLGGKILRVDVDGNPPSGNPFGTPVWSLGHRNVQGMAWDAEGRMYASEFGQNDWDELNRIEPGKNYGWPDVEGMGDDNRFTNPLHVWNPDAASPSGLAYLDGNLYMAGLKGQSVWRIPVDGGDPERLLQGRFGRVRTLEPTGDGGLYLISSNTFRGTPKPGDDRVVRWYPAD